MSSPDSFARGPVSLRRLAVGAAMLLAAAAAGCSVQPLYSETTSSTTGMRVDMASALASINVVTEQTRSNDQRVAQEVRNHLIFLFGGGAGAAAQPAYGLSTAVTTRRTAAARVQPTTRDEEPTAAVVTVRVQYVMTDARSGERIAGGIRLATAAFDISRQEFASVRAERDAQNRAAREAAELVRMAVAQELVRSTGVRAPQVISAPEEIEVFRPVDETGDTPG